VAITREQIIQAAEALAAEGVNPSMQAVRDRLGGGSYATISPALRDWRESRQAQTAAVLEMPAEMKGALERAGAELWRTASTLATQQLEAIRAEAQERIAAATQERDEALAEIARHEAALEEQTKTAHQAQAALAEARGEAHRFETESAALAARLDDRQREVEDLKAQLAKQDGRLDRLQAELVELAREKKAKKSE
jgi:chromosome segregation ATPase